MIGVSGNGLHNCEACGECLHESELHADYETCFACGDERAAEAHAELVADFRGLAHDWFTGVAHMTLAQAIDRDDRNRRADRSAA